MKKLSILSFYLIFYVILAYSDNFLEFSDNKSTISLFWNNNGNAVLVKKFNYIDSYSGHNKIRYFPNGSIVGFLPVENHNENLSTGVIITMILSYSIVIHRLGNLFPWKNPLGGIFIFLTLRQKKLNG